MSSPGSAPPLVLEIGPSRLAAIALVSLYGAAGLALLAIAVPTAVRVATAALLLLVLRRDWRLHVRRDHPAAITALAWTVDGCRVRTRDGRWWRAEQRQGGLVTVGVVVLPLVLPERPPAHRHRGLVLPADAASGQARRRLRMRLLNP